jgi:hypothetical protein
LNFMFNEKSSNPVGTMNRDHKVQPYQLLREELLYPTRKDIQQTYDLTCQLACEAASIFLMEFHDPTKATSEYLSSISGPKSWCNTSDETKSLTLNVLASNSMLEANHASSTVGLKLSGTIRLDHVCAEGQTRHNNDFGRGHEVLVQGRGSRQKSVDRNLGTFTNLCEEHQRSIIQAAVENAQATRRRFDDALERYAVVRREKEELAMQKKIDASREEYIVGIYFYEMYHSERCWKTKRVARAQFGLLGSEAARLRAVKEQHLICTLGLGWMQAHHPWSKNGKVYSATHLLANLCLVVIPLAKELTVPDDAPVKLPTAPDVCTLGTLSAIGEEMETKRLETISDFKQEGREERDRRENEGLGDRWGEKQSVAIPEINHKFIGFKIEMLFNYTHDEGLSWCHGEVIAIKDAKKKTVLVKWAEEHVGEGEKSGTVQTLSDSKWNKSREGAWREYITE